MKFIRYTIIAVSIAVLQGCTNEMLTVALVTSIAIKKQPVVDTTCYDEEGNIKIIGFDRDTVFIDGIDYTGHRYDIKGIRRMTNGSRSATILPCTKLIRVKNGDNESVLSCPEIYNNANCTDEFTYKNWEDVDIELARQEKEKEARIKKEQAELIKCKNDNPLWALDGKCND